MKHLKNLILVTALAASPVFAAQAGSSDFDSTLLSIQSRWAEINYSMDKDQKSEAFEKLASHAKDFSEKYPNRAEPMIWQGIVLSTWAGAKGGLGALSLVKDARNLFEQSLSIDKQALNGSAYTSLGSLYYQVPGWPIGFGDDDKAQQYLQKALSINPNGIDANYFYADYLIDQGDYKMAENYLHKALQAPDRPQRQLADKGRREEINAKLALVKKQAKNSFNHDSLFN